MSRCSKVAAATAAVVPFSCVVCFEEFNTTDRPPMVLPCGHTYVCMMCSKRLKRCMECREPLFIHPSKACSKTPVNASNSTYGRGRYSPTPSTPPQLAPSPAQPIALPIPKNLVLLSMMEAAERNKCLADTESDVSDDEEEAFDLNQIISGMSTLAGPCGTYAVKSLEPLYVLQHDPRIVIHDEEKKIEEEKEHGQEIKRGQTVQVVDFRENVAVLARGAGFIVAQQSELVKVGGPLDISCRLEGVLRTIEDRGNDLAKTLEENNATLNALREQIAQEKEKEASHPIISHPREDPAPMTPTSPSTPIKPKTIDVEENIHEHLAIPSPNSMSSMTEARENINSIYRGQFAGTHSPNSIDNSDIVNSTRAMLRQTASADDTFNHFVFGCGSGLFGQSSIFGNPNALGRSAARGRSSSGDVAALTDHAHNRIGPASSFDTVSTRGTGLNFRTGFSGHRGFFSTKTARSERPRGQIRMMGEHRGVSGVTRRNSPSNSPSNARSFQTISHDF